MNNDATLCYCGHPRARHPNTGPCAAFECPCEVFQGSSVRWAELDESTDAALAELREAVAALSSRVTAVVEHIKREDPDRAPNRSQILTAVAQIAAAIDRQGGDLRAEIRGALERADSMMTGFLAAAGMDARDPDLVAAVEKARAGVREWHRSQRYRIVEDPRAAAARRGRELLDALDPMGQVPNVPLEEGPETDPDPPGLPDELRGVGPLLGAAELRELVAAREAYELTDEGREQLRRQELAAEADPDPADEDPCDV